MGATLPLKRSRKYLWQSGTRSEGRSAALVCDRHNNACGRRTRGLSIAAASRPRFINSCMGHPKVQHYVPQFLLRGFVRGTKKQLHVFDKQTGQTFSTKPHNVAGETGFYDIEIPEGVLTMEPTMGHIESAAAGVIDRVRKDESFTSLSEEDRIILALFVAVQHLRTQQFRANLLDMDRQLQRILGERGGDVNNVRNYTPLRGAEDVKAASMGMLPGLAVALLPHILDKTWLLLRASPETPFIIGDNPVALDNQHDFGFYGNIGFGVHGIEIYMPISDTLSGYFLCPSHSESFARSFATLEELRTVTPDHPEVQRLQQRVGPMFAALHQGVPLPCSSDVILRHNSLQVLYAERWLFSPNDNFELPNRMIADNPNRLLK